MRFENQRELARYVEEKLADQIRRAEELTGSLSVEQRGRLRHDGGWSVDQILSHLARTNETYLHQLNRIETGRQAPEPSPPRWKPTIGGRLLRWSVTSRLRIRTPRVFRPEERAAGGDALEAFVVSQRQLLETIARFRGLNWRLLRCTSPASGLVKLNAGDVFLVLAEHGDRHLEQLERQCADVSATSPMGAS